MTEVVRRSDDDSISAKLAACPTASPLDVLRTFPSLAPLLEPIGAQLLSKIEPLLEWFGMPAGTGLFQEGEGAREAYILQRPSRRLRRRRSRADPGRADLARRNRRRDEPDFGTAPFGKGARPARQRGRAPCPATPSRY